MLTVDYDRLGLEAGHELLDLGCGFGRHAFEAARRGAHVTACDMAVPELVDVRNTFGAMHDAGELDDSVRCAQIAGDATRLPFGDNTFDRIIASEVLEHIPSDIDALAELTRVLKPGGVIAATVPTFLPERICWAINSDYHAPASVGGHLRIYTRGEMRAKMAGVGLQPIDAHQTHGLHSPYWWLKCAVGIENNEHRLVKKYHDLLVWEITNQPKILQWAGKILDPLIGKSTIVYAEKVALSVSTGVDIAGVAITALEKSNAT
ncbi:MAG: class I SAM-dependent methyltransferase [Acidimicrobiales bacterium]|mgnify:FL=1